MLLRSRASGHLSRRALKGALQDEVDSYIALILRSRAKHGVSKDGRLRGLLPLAALIITTLHASEPLRAAEADLIEQGRDLYADTCAICHGRDMVNTGALAFDLRKFPKNDFRRFRNSVLNGKNASSLAKC